MTLAIAFANVRTVAAHQWKTHHDGGKRTVTIIAPHGRFTFSRAVWETLNLAMVYEYLKDSWALRELPDTAARVVALFNPTENQPHGEAAPGVLETA